jgi:hypothetical protein
MPVPVKRWFARRRRQRAAKWMLAPQSSKITASPGWILAPTSPPQRPSHGPLSARSARQPGPGLSTPSRLTGRVPFSDARKIRGSRSGNIAIERCRRHAGAVRDLGHANVRIGKQHLDLDNSAAR